MLAVSSSSIGSSETVRKPCATVPWYVPCFAFSTSTCSHWWSPVASANSLTCCWVIWCGPLSPSTWPTRAFRSSTVYVCMTGSFLAWRGLLVLRRQRGGNKGVLAGDVAADDQRLERVGALVRVDRLDVGEVPGDVIVQHDPIPAEDVARLAEDGPGAPGAVHLGQRDHRHGDLALVHQLAEPQHHECHAGDVGQHRGQLLLDELEARERVAELAPLLGIGKRRLVAGHRRAERLPGHGESRGEQHLLDVAEGVAVLQLVRGRHADVGQGDLGVLDHP